MSPNDMQKLVLLKDGYLDRVGWSNSKPIDSDGPTPSYTYPSIYFLKDFLHEQMRVYEYGCGYSTLFYSRRSKEVFSVEHNELRVNAVRSENPQLNVKLVKIGDPVERRHIPLLRSFQNKRFELPLSQRQNENVEHGLLGMEFAAYALSLCHWPRGHFDVVVVDGMARVLSGFVAAHMLRRDGLIILDNSDRWQYNALQNFLVENGFKRIDFYGPGPTTPNHSRAWITSLFFKDFPAFINRNVARVFGIGDLVDFPVKATT